MQLVWFEPYFDSPKRKNHLGRSCRGSARFYSSILNANLNMILTIMIVHLKMLSINVRNSTFNHLFVYLMCICVLLYTVGKIWCRDCFPPKITLRMKRLCSNVHLSQFSKTHHRHPPWDWFRRLQSEP